MTLANSSLKSQKKLRQYDCSKKSQTDKLIESEESKLVLFEGDEHERWVMSDKKIRINKTENIVGHIVIKKPQKQ